jgi:hypothetical protein
MFPNITTATRLQPARFELHSLHVTVDSLDHFTSLGASSVSGRGRRCFPDATESAMTMTERTTGDAAR